jgi:hypothetical protein
MVCYVSQAAKVFQVGKDGADLAPNAVVNKG